MKQYTYLYEVEMLKDLKVLIDLHFKKQHQVKYYAGYFGLTAKYLNVISFWHWRKTVSTLIRLRLLWEGRRLLRTTDLPVKVIAYELGFASPDYFGHFFRKNMGFQPGQYRKASRNNDKHPIC